MSFKQEKNTIIYIFTADSEEGRVEVTFYVGEWGLNHIHVSGCDILEDDRNNSNNCDAGMST